MVELSRGVSEVSYTVVDSNSVAATHPDVHQSPRLVELNKHWSGAGEGRYG